MSLKLLSKKNSNVYLVMILVIFSILGILYSLYTPTWEESDGSTHWGYIKTAAEGNLDSYYYDMTPPLYYFITAGFLSLYDSEEPLFTDAHAKRNFFEDYNKLRHLSEKDFPFSSEEFQKGCFSKVMCTEFPENLFESGTVQVVHLLRLFSVFVGVLTLFFTYKIAKEVFRGNNFLVLSTVSFTAFIPMFVFINSVLTNEILSILFSTITIYSFITYSKSPRYRTIFIIGIFTGLGLITKITSLFLIPGIILCLLFLVFSNKITKKQFTLSIFLFLIISFVVGGWWHIFMDDKTIESITIFAYNIIGNSDSSLEKEFTSRYPTDNKLSYFVNWERNNFIYFESVFGNIGWSAIKTHPILMDIVKSLLIIPVIGLIFHFFKITSSSEKTISRDLIIIMLIFFSFILFNSLARQFVTGGGTGRNLLPAVVPFSTLVVAGFYTLTHKFNWKIILLIPISVLLILNFALLIDMNEKFEHGLPRDPIHDYNHNLKMEIWQGSGIEFDGIPISRIRSTYLEDRTHDTLILLHPPAKGPNWWNFTMSIPDENYDLEINYGFLIDAKGRAEPVEFSIYIDDQLMNSKTKKFDGHIGKFFVSNDHFTNDDVVISLSTDSLEYGNYKAWAFYQVNFIK